MQYAVIVIFVLFIVGIIILGCKSEGSDPTINPRSTPTIKFDTTTPTISTKSILRNVVGTTVNQEITGFYSRGMTAVTWAKRIGETLQTTNELYTNPPIDWSAFWFATDRETSRHILIKDGDVTDISQYQDPVTYGDENYKTFSDEFYTTVPYFNMDIIEVCFSNIALVHNENGVYKSYGYMTQTGIPGPDDVGTPMDQLYKYPGYTYPMLPTTPPTEDPTYRSFNTIRFENYPNYDSGSFGVLFVNKNLLDPLRTAGTIIFQSSGTFDPVNITGCTGDLTEAEQLELTSFFSKCVNNSRSQLLIVVPIDMKKIKMATGVDAADTINNPVININFGFGNVLSLINTDYYTAHGLLADDIYSGPSPVLSDVFIKTAANGYPFGLTIDITEQ